MIKDSSVSNNNLRSQWIKLLQRTNIPEENKKDFGLHSLHISSATNTSYGCGELEIQHLGRWKSTEMARSYVYLEEEVLARPGSVLLRQLMAMYMISNPSLVNICFGSLTH